MAEEGPVYHVPIHGTIDMGLPHYIQRVVMEAEENDAEAIIFDIDTFGGRVDAATQIKDIILDSKVTTIAFINKRAISAGALISLSCDSIFMTPGASIGAATAVDLKGNKASEKVSFLCTFPPGNSHFKPKCLFLFLCTIKYLLFLFIIAATTLVEFIINYFYTKKFK